MTLRKIVGRLGSVGAALVLARVAYGMLWRAASFGAAGAVVAQPDAERARLKIRRTSQSSETERDRMMAFGDRHWAELLALGITLVGLAYVLHVLGRDALPPSGDSGQWLTISRYYLGESMPSDRSATVMPPVVPVALAAFSLVVAKPVAIVALAAVCYAAIAGMAFLLGRKLSGGAAGGLLAVLLVAVAQRELFEVIAVGAYPQLVALIGMAACLLALFSLARTPSEGRSWVLLAVSTGVVMFSHTPSATLLLPPLAVCLGYIVWSSDDRKRTLKSAFDALRPVALLWILFVVVNHEVVFGYASVPATFDLKGPDKMWNLIWHNDAQRMVFGGGALAVVALPMFLRGGTSWKSLPSVVLLLWTGTLGTMVLFSAFRHMNTDYPRFVAYFIVPLGVAAAAGIQACNPSRAVTLAIAAPLLLFAGYEGIGHLDDASKFYGVNSQSDELVDAAAWLNESGEEGAIIAGTRDTKWIQALTGRTSLLYLRRISITRPWEIERAMAAEVIHRSNGGIESGRLFTTVNDGGEDFGAVYPAGVRADIFHKGMYSPSLSFDDGATKLTFTSFGSERTISLATLGPGITSTESTDDEYRIVTRFASPKLGIEAVRVVSARADDPDALQIAYMAGTLPGVSLTQVHVSPGAWAEESMLLAPYGVPGEIDAPLFDGQTLHVEAESEWLPSIAAPDGANPFMVWQSAVLTLRPDEGEGRVDAPRLYDPAGVLQDYGVRYLIDRNGDGAAFPIIRALGREPVYTNGEVSVYDVGQ